MKTVGERIQQARKARGWSAEKLAEMVGYRHQSAIANIENRATTSGGQRLPKIAAALRVSPDWLLSGPDTHNVPFLPPKYLVPVPAEPAQLAAENGATWPFERAPISRIHRLIEQLGDPERQHAIDDIDRHLDIVVFLRQSTAHNPVLCGGDPDGRAGLHGARGAADPGRSHAQLH